MLSCTSSVSERGRGLQEEGSLLPTMAFREFVVVETSGCSNDLSNFPIESKVEEWLFEVDMDKLRSLAFSEDGYRFVSSENFCLSPHSKQMEIIVHIKAQEDIKRPEFLGLYLHTDGALDDDSMIFEGLSMGFIQSDGSIYLKSFAGATSPLGPDGLGWPDMIGKENCTSNRIMVIVRRVPMKGTNINKLRTVT